MDLSILRYELLLALRRLWRRPTQTGLLLTTFGISIALTLLSWSLFHTIFLKAPDFDPEGDLVVVNLQADTAGANPTGITRADIDTWIESQQVFSELTHVMMYRSTFISTGESSQRYLGALLSTDALRILGAQPLIGRLFTPEEDQFKCAPTILISEKIWRDDFGSDPSVLGRVVTVDGYAAEIVGVMPQSFRFPNSQDVWLPIGFNVWEWNQPEENSFQALARLKPGITPARAMQDLDVILKNLGSKTLANQYKLHPLVRPIREFNIFSELHQGAKVILVLSLIFILVSCANAANLVMIDFFGRSSELSAAISLGMPRWASIRNIAYQVMGVGLIAGVIGTLVMAMASPHLHNALVLMNAPYWLKFEFAWHHVAMALGLATLSAVAALIIPLVYLLIVSPSSIIRNAAGSNRGTGRSLWRRSLLIGQVALLTLLGVAASLLMQSNAHIGEEHWGYDASKVFLGKLDVPRVDFPEDIDRGVLFHKVVNEVRQIPGVRNAAITYNPPGYSSALLIRYARDKATLDNGSEDGSANNITASETFFDALGVPMLQGEMFQGDPTGENWRNAVINESLAKKLWPGGDAIGRTLYVRFPWTRADKPTEYATIVGVVQDFQASGPKSPNNDVLAFRFGNWMPSNLFLVVGGYQALPTTKEISSAVWRVDPRVVPYFPDSIKHQIDMTLGYVRLTGKLTTLYALAAALLCGLGIYSITVAQIIQRTREFGIRLALGIDPFRLWIRYALGHLISTVIGVGIGLIGAALVMQSLSAVLFGVEARDLSTYIIVPLGILAISILACIPSLFRLRKINPPKASAASEPKIDRDTEARGGP